MYNYNYNYYYNYYDKTVINLSRNDKVFEANFEYGDEVRQLNISKNGMKNIPLEILNLQKLVVLQCQYNKLTFIPSSVGNLKFIRYLNLSFNNFIQFPIEITHLSKLVYLNLRNNKIKIIPEEIKK